MNLRNLTRTGVIIGTMIPLHLLWTMHPKDYGIFFLCYVLAMAILYVYASITETSK